MRDASEAEQVPLRDRAVQSEPLTTSSSAALRPKEHVRCVRQLTKDEKSSRGMAVRTLRGNTVIRLLTMLEIPTASESSISILQPKAWASALSGAEVPRFQTCTHSFSKARLCVLISTDTYSSTLKCKSGGIASFFFPPLWIMKKNWSSFLALRARIPTHWWYSVSPQWSVRGNPLGTPRRGRRARAEKLAGRGTAGSPGPCRNLLWFSDGPVRKNR